MKETRVQSPRIRCIHARFAPVQSAAGKTWCGGAQMPLSVLCISAGQSFEAGDPVALVTGTVMANKRADYFNKPVDRIKFPGYSIIAKCAHHPTHH